MRKENPPSSQGQDLGKLDKNNYASYKINVSPCPAGCTPVRVYIRVEQFAEIQRLKIDLSVLNRNYLDGYLDARRMAEGEDLCLDDERWQGQSCDSCKLIDCPKNTTKNTAGLLVCRVCGWHRLGNEPDDNSYCVYPDPKTGNCKQPRQVECRDSLDPKCPMVYAKKDGDH